MNFFLFPFLRDFFFFDFSLAIARANGLVYLLCNMIIWITDAIFMMSFLYISKQWHIRCFHHNSSASNVNFLNEYDVLFIISATCQLTQSVNENDVETKVFSLSLCACERIQIWSEREMDRFINRNKTPYTEFNEEKNPSPIQHF